MKRFIRTRFLAVTAIALGAFGAASAVHAGSDLYFSTGTQPTTGYYGHPGYVQPQPVYVQPQPAYVQPRHVYVQPRHVDVAPAPVDSQPQPVYAPQTGYDGHRRYQDDRGGHHNGYHSQRRGPWGDHDGNGIPNLYDPNSPRNQHRHARLYGPYGDLDRDGIMNQDDRDRDGDGVRNRYDRFPDDPTRY